MRLLRQTVLPAVIGGAIVAAALLAFDAGGGKTTTVVQQSPITRQANRSGGDPFTAREIYRRAAPGVVNVQAQIVRQVESPFDIFPQEERGESTGSGFVVSKSGLIVTNAHVIEGAAQVTVKFEDKKTADAKVIGRDSSTDIALLKVDPDDEHLRPLRLGDSDEIQVGDPTIAIGNPFGLDRTLTTGVVSALQRRISAPNGFSISNVIQTDAAINPGNSGGPLLDAAGRVIGINSQIATGGDDRGNVGIAFAVPVDTLRQVMPQLEKKGRVSRAYLGIVGQTIDRSLDRLNLATDSGVLVQTVSPGSPAAKAGIRGGDPRTSAGGGDLVLGGDVLVSLEGRAVRSMEDVIRMVSARKPGDRVRLGIIRSGKRRTVTATLAERPTQAPAQ